MAFARVASENLGQAPPSGKGPLECCLPTRRRMLSGGPKWLRHPGKWPSCPLASHASSHAVGWPKWLIVRGSSGRGLQIAIFWVSACSVVRRAFLKPSRSASWQSGLPLLTKAVSDADRPESLRCHLAPLLTSDVARQGPRWSQTPLPGEADPLPGAAGTGQGSGPPRR